MNSKNEVEDAQYIDANGKIIKEDVYLNPIKSVKSSFTNNQ